jgi:hypothetical protein
MAVCGINLKAGLLYNRWKLIGRNIYCFIIFGCQSYLPASSLSSLEGFIVLAIASSSV